MPTLTDAWAAWLLAHRFNGDDDHMQATLASLLPVRDTILQNAALAGDETLLDIGCGDGLIGIGALEHLPDGTVIFSDTSADVLADVEAFTENNGVRDRCRFVGADVTDLAPIDSESVDVITMRSVLIYVQDKASALCACHRVLKPEGILSFFEPIHRFSYPEPAHRLWSFDFSGLEAVIAPIKALYREALPPDSPLLTLDTHDLITHLENAGFREIHTETHHHIIPRGEMSPVSLDTLLDSADIPLLPTPRDALQRTLSERDQQRVIDHLREQIESRTGNLRRAMVYAWAVK